MKKDGFTLIEILVVMAILGIMSVIMVGILNPIALTGRGYDARRKKDLGRIKVAFEEYFNDKECYPTEADLVPLRLKSNCGMGVFSPWMSKWPCDPNGQPYYVFVEQITCPRWFKLITNLENKKDNDTPSGWYEYPDNYLVGDGSLNPSTANYGTSSTNVLWYERVAPVGCGGLGTGCNYRPPGGGCNYVGVSCTQGADNCYLSEPTDNCLDRCKVSCCNNGLPCE